MCVPIILGIVFGWFSFFWFRSSSSRTRARPVWSLRDKRATSHHHRQWHQLQTDQTSNSSSSGSRWAREEPKKVFGEKILKPPVRGYSISVYRFRGYPPLPLCRSIPQRVFGRPLREMISRDASEIKAIKFLKNLPPVPLSHHQGPATVSLARILNLKNSCQFFRFWYRCTYERFWIIDRQICIWVCLYKRPKLCDGKIFPRPEVFIQGFFSSVPPKKF